MGSTDYAVRAEGLRKRYGGRRSDTVALDGFDLAVPAGSVHGLLGPERRRQDDRGAHPRHAAAGRRRPGRGRRASTWPAGRRGPAPDRAGRPARRGRRGAHRPAEPRHVRPAATSSARAARRGRTSCWSSSGSPTPAGKPAKQYSGGMRRRLDLAASLILAPAVLFLDEPTTGLDPRGRNEVWEAVRTLVAGGTTVLLTTQYLDEADQLADRISVIDSGRVIAEGTPDELKATLGGDRIDLVAAQRGPSWTRPPTWSRRTVGAEAEVDRDNRRVSAPVRRPGGGADRRACAASTTPASPPRTSRCAGPPWTRCSCTSPDTPPRRPRSKNEKEEVPA